DRLRRRRGLLGPRRACARRRARAGGADPRRRRPPRSPRRRLPRVVRPLDDLQDPPPVTLGFAANEEQRAAIDARGRVFVSAGAGTGKTAVPVERFVRAVCDDGVDVESVLVITYTRKAA